jgi:hypothetical protein
LKEHRDKLDRIAKALLTQETLTMKELNEIVGEAASDKQKRSYQNTQAVAYEPGPDLLNGEPAPAT